ncbi:MAG: YtxH domain-containing protein [Prevotellaceae bacterium]|jgi:gas vesicle protein|nr:YtxH domain-containing protein [Prevotellaceae bacterium]
MNKLNILLALCGGVAIGVAAGMLFAPEKGSKTRERLVRLAKDKKDELQDQIQDFLKSKGIDYDPEEVVEILTNH